MFFQWALEITSGIFLFPIAFKTLLMYNASTDFTWSSSGEIHTNWYRSLSFTNEEIKFADKQRRRVIAIGK